MTTRPFAAKPKQPRHIDQPRFFFDLKGWLIFFNLATDDLLNHISSWHGLTSLHFQPALCPLEQHVLALEDRHYFSHKGVDFRCAWRILKRLFAGKRVGGVSTIEQQYIRTFLNRKERTFGRKFNEVTLAWIIGHRAEKMQVLRRYLGFAYFGYRLNGADAVSDRVFKKAAAALQNREAAFVAALLVYPLPKLVQVDSDARGGFPVSDINAFIQHATVVAPKWARAVQRRMNYSMLLCSPA